jgi:hypothetical protein
MGIFGFGKKNKEQEKKSIQPAPAQPKTISSSIPSAIEMAKILKEGPSKPAPVINIRSEDIDHFLARNNEAKLVKLIGKPEDLADYAVGNKCDIEQDIENDEKYNVLIADFVIGRLPASAISFAEDNDCDPEDLDVIVAEVDYDLEKDCDIISVYVAV